LSQAKADKAVKKLEDFRAGVEGRIFDDFPVLEKEFAAIFKNQKFEGKYRGLMALMQPADIVKNYELPDKLFTDLIIYMAVAYPDKAAEIVRAGLDSDHTDTAVTACLAAEMLLARNGGKRVGRLRTGAVVAKAVNLISENRISYDESKAVVQLLRRIVPKQSKELLRQVCLKRSYSISFMLDTIVYFDMPELLDWAINLALKKEPDDRTLEKLIMLANLFRKHVRQRTLCRVIREYIKKATENSSWALGVVLHLRDILNSIADKPKLLAAVYEAICENEPPENSGTAVRLVVQALKLRVMYDLGFNCCDELQQLRETVLSLEQTADGKGDYTRQVGRELFIDLLAHAGLLDECLEMLNTCNDSELWSIAGTLYFDMPIQQFVRLVKRMSKERQTVVISALMQRFSQFGGSVIEVVRRTAMPSLLDDFIE